MKIDKENLAVVRQAFANAAFSHKVQEMAAERKEKRITIFKVLNICLIGLVLLLFLLQATTNSSPVLAYIGAGLTAAEIVLLISQLTFGIEQEVVAHKNSALKYMSLRDRYKSTLADITRGVLVDNEFTRTRDNLLKEYQMISDLSVQTTGSDYDNAMAKLKLTSDGQNVWSDKQIDSLLPRQLRSVS
jgi:cell shape-determining protein MreC